MALGVVAGGLRVMLWGRTQQCALLDGLIAETRAGRSRALVVHGEPGIGKTALLEYAADAAPDFQVARAEGVESEMELPFAALHLLCRRMLDRLDGLPVPQRDALGVAFGLQPGSAPNRFLVGLAVLGLLSDVAADQPLLALVDDAHWLDQASAQVLTFVARRLDAESVGLLFGTREVAGEGCLAGLPELVLDGLSDSDARALLASALPGRLDERVRDRIVAECGGNPLALLELPRASSTAELAGGFGSAGSTPVESRVGRSFLWRIAALPHLTMRLLLLAAAEPTGDPELLWRAAESLDITAADSRPAEVDGLLTIGDRVTFRHPLVRSAVYQSASAADRRRAHRALAEATDRVAHPDRCAWHLAQATTGPDEEIAAELEQSASRAQARGGPGAAAAFFERAANLTADPALRARRALAAAHANYLASAFDAAQAMLATAEAGPLDEFQRARAELLRGQIAFASSHGSAAPALLLKAARQFEPLDPGLAREVYLEALFAATFAGRFAIGAGVREVAAAARTAPPPPKPLRAPDLLLDGLALMTVEDYQAGAPIMRRATRAFCTTSPSAEDALRWTWHSCLGAALLWDFGSWDFLSARWVKVARDVGALTALPRALTTRAIAHLVAGEFAKVTELVAELKSVTEATATGIAPYAALGLAVFARGEAEVSELIETSSKDAERRGEGGGLTFSNWATAVLCNGLGRYEQALEAAQQAIEAPRASLAANWAAAEFVEAATRIRMPERAAGALQLLCAATSASGTDWALGVEARSRALVTDGDNAEVLYREAIDRLGRTRLQVDLARAHLLYGEWLRRAHRRIDARGQLRTAHQMLAAMGAVRFADRAARELRATGERVSKRTREPSTQLTAREDQIARLADDGLSNPEIAARLFMSPRTVEYHLRKVFTKLAISSRNQLHRALTR
jgi:DNA-binding CsgD family transcriptional regulator/tetratricopeptide (TPR) repeat protein